MGMVLNTLYNLTDIWFAGHLGDDALAGLSIAGSVFFLLLSIGLGIQAGASAMIAPEVGRGALQSAVKGAIKGGTSQIKYWINNVTGMAIAGQNLGAGNNARVAETYQKSLLIGLAMAVVSIPVMYFLSPLMMGFFTNTDAIKNTGVIVVMVSAVIAHFYTKREISRLPRAGSPTLNPAD